MIFTIKGEIIETQKQEDFVVAGWYLTCHGRREEKYVGKVWTLTQRKFAEKALASYIETCGEDANWELVEIYIKKESK